MKKPTRLYHATRPANVESIREKGLLASAFGEVYFCESVEECTTIIGPRIAVAHAGIDWFEVTDPVMAEKYRSGKISSAYEERNGVVYAAYPKMEQNTHMAVVEVDVSKMNASALEVSTDHDPRFFGDLRSWAYYRDVPPTAIIDITLQEIK